jgi:hypothetical protein
MSTGQKPLPASCDYFDRHQYWLGLPRIAHGLDRLDSFFALGADLAADRAGGWFPMALTSTGAVPVGDEPAGHAEVGGAPAPLCHAGSSLDALDDLRATMADLGINCTLLLVPIFGELRRYN